MSREQTAAGVFERLRRVCDGWVERPPRARGPQHDLVGQLSSENMTLEIRS